MGCYAKSKLCKHRFNSLKKDLGPPGTGVRLYASIKTCTAICLCHEYRPTHHDEVITVHFY